MQSITQAVLVLPHRMLTRQEIRRYGVRTGTTPKSIQRVICKEETFRKTCSASS